MSNEIQIAFLSDLHYAAQPNKAIPARRGEYISRMLARIIRKLNREIRPDLVLFGGDMINNPEGEDAMRLTADLAEWMQLLDMPYTVIRGNHDMAQAKFTRFFPFRRITDADFVRIAAFDDPELPGYNAERTDSDREQMKLAAENWDGILFSFQHTPLTPRGSCVYGYENAGILLKEMRDLGYRGTLSGHEHSGRSLWEEEGLQFMVQEALCEAPHAFSLLHVAKSGIKAVERIIAASEEDFL